LWERCAHYLHRAAAGDEFLITRRGKPVAHLSPPQASLLDAASS